MGYHSMIHVCTMIAGVETMQMLCEGKVPCGFMKSEAECARNVIHCIFNLARLRVSTYSNRKSNF